MQIFGGINEKNQPKNKMKTEEDGVNDGAK